MATVSDEKREAIRPMLAETYDDGLDPTGWWISEKLDGMRALWTGRRLLTRNGNPIEAPFWFTIDLPDEPLDGELWVGRGGFQRTLSIVRGRAERGRWSDVRFMVFDAPARPGGFEQRLGWAMAWFRANPSSHAQCVLQKRCRGRAHLEAELERITSRGGEGLVLRRAGSAYEPRRAECMLKVKRFDDAEAVVVGYESGRGRNAERVGALRVRLAGGVEFRLGTGLSEREREAPPQIGVSVVFRHCGVTDSGVPRHATYVGCA